MTKLALIGTGWAAKSYAEIKSKEFRIETVIGHNIKESRNFSRKYNILNYSDKIEDVLANNQIKGVIICTPPDVSLDLAKYFLQKKIDVLIEKPGAVSSQRLKELIQYEKSSKAFLAYQLRYDSNILLAKKIIENKNIGEIDSAYFRMFFPGMKKDKESYRKWSIGKKSPSVWIESGVHLIDLATYLMGEEKEIMSLNTKFNEQIVSGTAIVKHNNDSRSTLDVSFCGGENNIRGLFELYSTEGSIQINRGTYLNKNTSLIVENNGNIIDYKKMAKEDGILNQTNSFARWCELKKTPMKVDLNRGIKILKIAEEIEKFK